MPALMPRRSRLQIACAGTGCEKPSKKKPIRIAVHPDARRVVGPSVRMPKSARAFTYWIASEIDKELSHPDEAVRQAAADNVALS